jgi:hypothetical protein
MRVSLTAAADHRNLIPGDFERASVFEVVGPINNIVLRSNLRSTRFWRFHDPDYGLTGTNASEYS